MDLPESVATVIRVTRNDTIFIRSVCPMLQSKVSLYMTPAGVWCGDNCADAIIDWVECHADAERLKLIPFDWMRDEHGKLIADLADIQSGEQLTDYLVSCGAAKPRPHHMLDAMYSLMGAKEPE